MGSFLRYLPTALTLVRIVCIPFLISLLASHRFTEALILTLIAGVTDWLDGFLARALKVTGNLGVVLDPAADKLLLVALFLTLGWNRLIPFWMLALVIGRDLVIATGALLLRVFRGYRQFLPSTLGKVSTFFQILLVLLVLIDAAFPYTAAYWLMLIALSLSALFTALSWIGYVRRGISMTKHRQMATGAH